MAMTATASNHFKFQLASGNIDMANDTFKAILMNTIFVFDPDAHATLADVTADQIASGNGYLQDDKTLTGVTLTEDDSNDRASMTCENPSWNASGGSIGPFGAMIIYDDTTADDTVVNCIDFGTDYTVVDNASFSPTNNKISLV